VKRNEYWLVSDLLKRSRVLSLGNNRFIKESVQTSDPLWETLAAFVYSIFRNKLFSCLNKGVIKYYYFAYVMK